MSAREAGVLSPNPDRPWASHEVHRTLSIDAMTREAGGGSARSAYALPQMMYTVRVQLPTTLAVSIAFTLH